ncbi:MAG: hypothetical protein KR126chlam1_00834 [Chlamydiae bacterium]|nr:hypothetical protein [Chlamydiota bacterium]
MTAQQYITATSPSFAAERGALNLVSEKEKNKQQKELRHLGALVQMLEKDVARAKGGAKRAKEVQSAATNGASPASTKFEKAMADMVMALQMLQVMITKYEAQRNNLNGQIAQYEVKLAKENLQKIQNEMTKVHEESEKEKTAKFWETFATVFVTAVVDVVAIASGQPEIAILTTAMCALSESGAFKSATKGVANLLEDMSMHKEAANITASVVITLAVIAVTYGIAPTSAASEAANTTEEASDSVEMTTMNASEDAQEADTTEMTEETETEANSSKSMLSKFKSAFNKYNSVRADLMIMNGMQAASSTGVVTNIAEAIATDMNYSSKRKKALEEELTIIMAVISMVVCLLSGAAMAEGMADASSEVDTATRYGRFVQQLRDMTAGSKLLSAVNTARQTGLLVEAGAGTAKGIFVLDQGVRLKKLGEYEADFSLVRTAERMNAQEAKQAQLSDVNNIKQQNIDNESIANLMAGEAGIANILDTPV